MTPERWGQIDKLFQAALDHPPGERAAFLDEVCAGDEELRSEIESLIGFRERASDFIETPAFEAAADLLAEDEDESPTESSDQTIRSLGDSPPAQPATQTGMTLKDRYLIEKELGRGGIGVVYLARDQQLFSKPVVVKILLEKSAENAWLKKKFRQEIEALSRIDHPGVVGVLDAGETADGKLFLVMQFVEGVSLRSLIEPEGMDFEQVASIIEQLGAALDAAHDKGVIHCDLKPENIMVQDSSGGQKVRVVDFGIAKIRDSQVKASRDFTNIA